MTQERASYGVNECRKELEQKHGMTGHPKAEKVWALAWEQGHAYGYSEVAYYYDMFAELAK